MERDVISAPIRVDVGGFLFLLEVSISQVPCSPLKAEGNPSISTHINQMHRTCGPCTYQLSNPALERVLKPGY